MKLKLLLHTCCGPCFLGVCEDLKQKDLEVTIYFYNPNIYPEAEHAKRLENLRAAAKVKKIKVMVDEYDAGSYDKMVEGLGSWLPSSLHSFGRTSATRNDNGERCLGCYKLRLEKTAHYAKEHGFDAFSSTLLVSPYQQHDALKAIGEEIADKSGIKFYYTDWRPFFREGQNEARTLDLYRQKYCGCEHSLRERSTE